jgi:hypothetical protein
LLPPTIQEHQPNSFPAKVPKTLRAPKGEVRQVNRLQPLVSAGGVPLADTCFHVDQSLDFHEEIRKRSVKSSSRRAGVLRLCREPTATNASILAASLSSRQHERELHEVHTPYLCREKSSRSGAHISHISEFLNCGDTDWQMPICYEKFSYLYLPDTGWRPVRIERRQVKQTFCQLSLTYLVLSCKVTLS